MPTLYVSVYGDGALLDATTKGTESLRHDEEMDENGDPNPTAILELLGVPVSIVRRAVDYCRRDNQGADPYSDGYEAMECVNAAETVNVLECDVPWSPAECKRLGGCFLCGGMHEER
jgi:hypothetical protein